MERFRTNDLLLASYLQLNECELLAVQEDPRRPQHGLFIFTPNKRIGELSALFYGKEASVEPRSYMSTLRDLKNEVERIVKR